MVWVWSGMVWESTLGQNMGVMLAQLVKASVGQADVVKASVGQEDVQRFELHLGHNWLSCSVFLVKSSHFGLPVAQTTVAKLAISISGWLGRYTNVEYLQSCSKSERVITRGQNIRPNRLSHIYIIYI